MIQTEPDKAKGRGEHKSASASESGSLQSWAKSKQPMSN